ncbi:MAG: hypothetical protein LBF26_03215 [Puniceicoccales bacterium]|nr:hypothetical protein [Puniceicoccales bacterium]
MSNATPSSGVVEYKPMAIRLPIPGKPTPLMWFVICTCTPLAIAGILCPFFFPFHRLVEIAIWTLGGTTAVISIVTIAWSICEMLYNKNAASFNVHIK